MEVRLTVTLEHDSPSGEVLAPLYNHYMIVSTMLIHITYSGQMAL